MFELVHATFEVSLLGFALALLYYLHFSQRQRVPVYFGKTGTAIADAVAMVGLALFIAIAPAIALLGIETIYGFLQGHGLAPNSLRLIAGIWIEVAIIAGWLFEYSLQRKARNLPAINFSFP